MTGTSPSGHCHRWEPVAVQTAAGIHLTGGMQTGASLLRSSQKATGSLQATERTEFMLDGLSAALQARSEGSSEEEKSNSPSRWEAKSNTPSLVDCFRARRPFKVDLAQYILRIRQYIPCSDACFVLCLVYIDRISQEKSLLIVDGKTCHRLVLTGIMLATRFLDDEEELHYDNAFFANVGGFRATELATMERVFLQMLRWRLFVSVAEYEQYLKILCVAALHCGVQMAN